MKSFAYGNNVYLSHNELCHFLNFLLYPLSMYAGVQLNSTVFLPAEVGTAGGSRLPSR